MTEPPAPKGVTPSKVRYRPLSQTRNPLGWKVLALSIAGAVVGGTALFLFAGKTAQDEMEGRGHFDRTITIEPEHSQVYHLTSLIGGFYELDVSAHDGPVIMACGMLEKGDVQEIDPAELERIERNGVLVQTGKRHRLNGKYFRGKFYWSVINPSKDKPVEVTIKFNS